MKCHRCKGKLTCPRCTGRKGGAARVAKGFAKTGGARAAALRRWDIQHMRDSQKVLAKNAALLRWRDDRAGGQVADRHSKVDNA